MSRTAGQRRAALDDMPRSHYSRRAFALGLKAQAIVAEGVTDIQRSRLESELQPIVQRIQVLTGQTNLRGELAAQLDRAHAALDDIAPGWVPRPDNPVERQCRDELGYSVVDL